MVILILLVAFFTSYISIYLLLKLPSKMSALDKPNHRSLHTTPISRLGGIGILIGAAVAYGLLMFESLPADNTLLVVSGLLIIATISFLDDIYSLGSLLRMIVQISAAVLVVYAGFVIDVLSSAWFTLHLSMFTAALLTLVYIVWMVNLYNFMDGIDGLAGGMAIFGFGTLAVIGFMEGQFTFAVYSLVIASSSLGFLFWNYPPARIFMGDSGSSSLGFLAATFSIWAHVNDIAPIWISLVVFSPFIVDATVTLFIRVARRERFWAAHKTHHYQLLAESGMSRKKLVNFEYVLMLVCSCIAIITHNASSKVHVFFIISIFIMYVVLIIYIRKLPAKPVELGEI